MGEILDADPEVVIDLAADFRVGDGKLYERYYAPHERPELCREFVYGLADVLGPELEGRRRIAVPGCFATAALLALHPLAVGAGFAAAPVCFAATGSSGSGASPKRTTHHPVRAHNFFGYATKGHRHEAEILDRLREWTGDPAAAAALLPHSAPLVRGIHLTLHARPADPLPDPSALYRGAYASRPFLRVLPHPPELSAVTGTNYAHLHAAARREGEEVVTQVAIDNLVKGAAGQAVQAMNLSLGLSETVGLDFPGIYPC
jgi:N-acetyl-gamma-glutamyl-phosphate reductase common form